MLAFALSHVASTGSATGRFYPAKLTLSVTELVEVAGAT